jgi:hypothetical protein
MSSIISIAKGCKLHIWFEFINLGKKTILVELCIGNYVVQDCLVKGANGIFQNLITLLNSQKNGYYLIVWNVVNSQHPIMHMCMQMKYIIHGHQYNPYQKIFKLV